MPISLVLGIALGGLLTGYMVAGSASPVVGAVVPALLTAFAGAVALIFKNPFDEKLVTLLKESQQNDKAVAGALNELKGKGRRIASQLGVVLVAFFLSYAGGCVVGTLARVQRWFASDQSVPEALKVVASDASSLEEALDRIRVYRVLQAQGFSEATISNIIRHPRAQFAPVAGHRLAESTPRNQATNEVDHESAPGSFDPQVIPYWRLTHPLLDGDQLTPWNPNAVSPLAFKYDLPGYLYGFRGLSTNEPMNRRFPEILVYEHELDEKNDLLRYGPRREL